MVFSASTPPDITESLPAELARRITASAGYVNSGARYDVSIGGLPFLLAVNDQRPYQRQTADFRKQQFDTSKEAGEQSLDQWWTRDQASWHRGAGINFYEPGADDGTQYRFAESVGVDVWTQGQASLLHKMDLAAATGPGDACYATTARVGGVDCYFTNEAGSVVRRTASTATTYSGATTVATPVAVAGAKILAGTGTTIVSGNASGSTLSNLWTSLPSTATPYWAKSRIIATAGTSIYELTLAGGDIVTDTVDPIYTHPDTGWTWTGVAESPSAILACGYGNGVGAIYRFALEDDASSTVPKLGQPYQVAEFPPGEEVHAIRVYLGQYVAIGTSRGLRIALIDGNGDLQYGPLVVTTTKPVRALNARDSYVYAGVEDGIDGASGVVRVNLAESVDGGLRFAWANDVHVHVTGVVESVAFLGDTDRVVTAVTGQGVYLQSDTTYEDSGYITSGRIRFATTEPKAFRRAKVRAVTSGGGVALSTLDESGTEAFVFRIGPTYNTNNDVAITSPSLPQQYLSVKLTLEAGSSGAATPVLEGVQVKALPQVKRQRLIAYPLLCLDRETDSNGVPTGYHGGAADRLFALEGLEDLQAVVQVEDYTNGESFSAQIERVELTRNTPPSKGRPNFGGYVTVTVRRL